MVAIINDWSNSGKEYWKGVRIIEDLRPKSIWLSILKAGETSICREILYRELAKIDQEEAKSYKSEPIVRKVPVTNPDSKPINQTRVSADEIRRMPKKCQKAYVEIVAVTKEIAEIHDKYFLANSTEENARLGSIILSLDDKRKELWEEIDYWRENKKAKPAPPKEKQLKELPKLELLQKRNNIRTSLSKAKARKNEALARKHQADLDEIKTLLDGK